MEFVQGYGLTETSPMAFQTNYKTGSINYGTIGWPAPSTEAKLAKVGDTNFIGIDTDEDGELLIRSPSVMKGYSNNKSATDETLVGDGWLRTGDIASYDVDGFFYIKDRLKELIKVKGYQVPPAELEEVLRDHPDILDAGVIGVKHSAHGEVPKAFVVLRKGRNLTEHQVQEHVAKRVSVYKHLTGGVQFIEAIPKSATGKILRRELKHF